MKNKYFEASPVCTQGNWHIAFSLKKAIYRENAVSYLCAYNNINHKD